MSWRVGQAWLTHVCNLCTEEGESGGMLALRSYPELQMTHHTSQGNRVRRCFKNKQVKTTTIKYISASKTLGEEWKQESGELK